MLAFGSGNESALELFRILQTTTIMLFAWDVGRAKGKLGLSLQSLNPRTHDSRL